MRRKTRLQPAIFFLLAATDPEAAEVVASEFELKPPPVPLRVTPQDCRRSGSAGDIVVCGRRRDEHRLVEVKVPKGMEIDEGEVIGVDLGGARLEPSLSQVGMPDGRVSKRIMVTVKVPF